MTDVAAAPLKITIYPQPPAPDAGRAVNANATAPNVPDSPHFWGQNGISFKSFLDVVNPLQHLPIVATLYQSVTGDVPSPGSDLAGGALYGGALGFASSLINEITKTQTGGSIGGNILALLQGSSETQLAQNDTSGGAPFLPANQRAAYNAYVRANALG